MALGSIALTLGMWLAPTSAVHADTQGLSHNYRMCAKLLIARPDGEPSAEDRALILSNVNAAAAELRAKYNARPKNLPPFPRTPDDVTPETLLAYVAEVKAMSKKTRKYYSLKNRLQAVELLVEALGRIDLETDIQAFQLVGKAEIDAYLMRLIDPSIDVEFAPHLDRIRGAAASATGRNLQVLAAEARRQMSKKIRKHSDMKTEFKYPSVDGFGLANRLRRYWSGESSLANALVADTSPWLHPDFIEIFGPHPDLHKLGWNGRDDRHEFLMNRRQEIIEEQYAFTANFIALDGTRDPAYLHLRLVEIGHLGNKFSMDLLPGWLDDASGFQQPVLTVVFRSSVANAHEPRPPRRQAVAPEHATDFVPGGLAPAR